MYFVLTATTMATMTCPTGISGLGGAADQIDVTCLDATSDKAFVRGLGNPGQVSVPFVMDPTSASHKELFTLMNSGNVINWLVALSDGTAQPTVAASQFVAPTGRTSFKFDAYVSDINVDIATNEVVRGTLTLQRAGAVTPTWKV